MVHHATEWDCGFVFYRQKVVLVCLLRALNVQVRQTPPDALKH